MSDGVSAAIELSDPSDPRVAAYSTLSDAALRRTTDAEHGIFLAESSVVVRRALAAGMRPASFFLAHRYLDSMADVFAAHPDVPVYTGTDETMQSITGFHLHRGALAAMYRPQARSVVSVLDGARRVALLDDVADHTNVECSKVSAESPQVGGSKRRSRIAIFENIVDHTNLGAAFRSAAAIGVDAVLVTPSCADPLYRRSIRVSMGTVFQVPWARIDSWSADIDLIKEHGYVVAGMTLGEGAITLDELVEEDHPHLALVFGTEGHGLTRQADRRLDRRVTIPMMHGVDSLNVAASAAVAFYATR
ncbi:TrmH family RNA methyltransferase [Citricoccus sp. NR2]|uniref:TrmH family RNA methyltransferase n=1 Tax=Citricoccus sp. NR2 TaxID=3004095 RepID=UPI0022DDBCE1|nr:RNA methyltransferase [Citricoccus sp. NR2]WBL18302.1 RNA methyltransferase [Citricoccus sp. NR2]